MWGSPMDVFAGMDHIVSAHVGIGVLPYIVAEMFAPAKAHRVVSNACRGITSIYTLIAVVCYFGWGDDVEERMPLEEVVMQADKGKNVATAIFVLLGIRTVAAYPIFFWAMWREINRCLGGNEIAATELRLPWAIRLQQRVRGGARVGLVALTWAPLCMSRPAFHCYYERMIKLPSMLVNFVFPAVLAVIAIVSHQAKYGTQASWLYVGGSIRMHLMSTIVSASIILCFFCAVLAQPYNA